MHPAYPHTASKQVSESLQSSDMDPPRWRTPLCSSGVLQLLLRPVLAKVQLPLFQSLASVQKCARREQLQGTQGAKHRHGHCIPLGRVRSKLE